MRLFQAHATLACSTSPTPKSRAPSQVHVLSMAQPTRILKLCKRSLESCMSCHCGMSMCTLTITTHNRKSQKHHLYPSLYLSRHLAGLAGGPLLEVLMVQRYLSLACHPRQLFTSVTLKIGRSAPVMFPILQRTTSLLLGNIHCITVWLD